MSERNKIVYSQWTFVDEDIQSGSIYLATSLMSDTLEANTISATVECSDKSIIDFERNTPLTYYSRGQQKGIFYVQSISRIGPELYEISATSAIGLLIEGLHYGGIYTGQTVAEVLPGICGTVPYVIKTNLRDIALYGWLPVATPRDNLAQVLFAIGATIKTDLDGVLHIEGLWDGVSGTFTRDRMYQGPSVDYASKVTQVVVTEHQYVAGGEETSLFEGTAQQGDIITFDEPMYNLQATGFTILESNANYAKVSAGSGTLTGNKYVHNTRQITKDVSSANEPNVKTATEATLVSLVNSEAVAQRMVNYYQCTQTINADAVYAGENPGDLLSTWHPYDNEAVSACVESVDISLSNTLKAAETSLVGFKPIQNSEESFVDTVEILTQSGSWTVPDSVTSIRAVLIGGGKGGTGGTGGNGCRLTTGFARDGSSIGPFDDDGVGPSGGQAGEAGSGGKILIVSIDVQPGQQFNVSIGSGGVGGAGGTGGQTRSSEDLTQGSDGADGTEGSETLFGAYTSETGSATDTGYTEIISGEIYGAKGPDGFAGGHGGGTYGEAQPGASVDGSSGGMGGGEIYNPGSLVAQGGGGGGAAYGANGHNGADAVYIGNTVFEVGGKTYSLYASGMGGNGADASAAENGVRYGCGGQGGHGGGGSGNRGAGYGNGSYAVSVFVNTGTATNATGLGGAGGKGGDGAPGCVILYYSLPKVVQSGSFVTSSNKYFLDADGRRLVV